MAQERIDHEDRICFRHVCARASLWGLLFIGLLAVCCSLPLIALSF